MEKKKKRSNMQCIEGNYANFPKLQCGKIRFFFPNSMQFRLHSNTYFNMSHYTASKECP